MGVMMVMLGKMGMGVMGGGGDVADALGSGRLHAFRTLRA